MEVLYIYINFSEDSQFHFPKVKLLRFGWLTWMAYFNVNMANFAEKPHVCRCVYKTFTVWFGKSKSFDYQYQSDTNN